jgi:hypothetical protein
MLYNKAWDTKTEPLTLAHFIQWLESKDPNEAYDASDAHNCALAQWVKSIDPAAHQERGRLSYCYNVNGKVIDLCRFREIVIESRCVFGAALERAKAIQNGSSSV